MQEERVPREHVLILGGTSDVAVALAAKFAREGYSISLAGRDLDQLNIISADLHIRYESLVDFYYFDALDFESHPRFYDELKIKPDIAICVFGLLGEQSSAQRNWPECAMIIDSNYTGAVSILNIIANDFEARKFGTIVGISSVAGDRGRQSNYLYGSAKAGFTTYLSGLRNRLFKSGVHVLTVKPGFMKTRMIEGMKTPAPLTANPVKVANVVYSATVRRRNEIYVLWMWRYIMLAIRFIPELIFKKLSL
jgi:decaprenylphospho-beta-D-erythro-pentofuranosid-2-ulose 2-reductase